MDFQLDRVQVWSCEIPDQPGGAAGILEPLSQAGAHLEFILSRRLSNKIGKGELFVAPITGPAQTKAAQAVQLHKANDMILLKIYGSDKPGLAHSLASCLANAGINLRSLTMTAFGGKFVAYVACDSPDDTAKAVNALAALKL
ncbi:MAG: amino acid-binding ACT [Planctomycetia bacterium]|nr:amino acid-binding ACT [Planctomycetia bacterium]